MEVIKEALTFDDVLLVPRYSSVLPSETAEDVAKKIHQLEYEHFPRVIEAIIKSSIDG